MAARQVFHRAALLLRISTLATLGISLWLWWGTPLASYYTDRTKAELSLAVDRLVHQEFDDAWFDSTVQSALSQTPVDWVLIESAEDIATLNALTLSTPTRTALDAARARDKGLLGQATNCAACAAGSPSCRIGDGLVCALGVEVTPIGDARALYSEGRAYLSGDPVDMISVSLAGIGLGATLAIIASGGTSATVKGGVATLRVARKAGRLSPALQARLAALGRDMIDVSKLPQSPRAMLDPAAYRAMINPAALAQGTALAADLNRMRGALPAAHALDLLVLVDHGGDARRMANLAEAGGARTVALTRHVGKSRALRLTARLSRTATTLIGLAIALALQALALLATLAQASSARHLRRRAQR